MWRTMRVRRRSYRGHRKPLRVPLAPHARKVLPQLNIRAVPLTYRGITFRSSLEADWAATFDALEIYWQYEPMTLQLPSGQMYLPDFYLPNLHTWAEVKGPHWERLDKAIELREAVNVPAVWVWQFIHVVILEAAGPGDAASWQAPDRRNLWLTDCNGCGLWGWVEDDLKCWRCRHVGGGQHYRYSPASAVTKQNEGLLRTYQMVRAPRPEIVGNRKGGK